MSVAKKSKYIITLKNVDVNDILTQLENDEKLNIVKDEPKNVTEKSYQNETGKIKQKSPKKHEKHEKYKKNTEISMERTNIKDIDKNSTMVSFVDRLKHPILCHVSQIDIASGVKLSQNTSIPCFWCRHTFKTQPIGCPVKFVSHRVVKRFDSEINKDNYTIKENVTSNKSRHLNNEIANGDDTLAVKTNGYFETDGIFCSFNCCRSYIQEHRNEPMYSNSAHLLVKMYNEIFKTDRVCISEAPDWRLIDDRGGGPLTIEKFREDFDRVTYDYHGHIKHLNRPILHAWEEKIEF